MKKQNNWTGMPEDSMGFLISNRDGFVYNVPFRVIGVQITNINNDIIGAWKMELKDENGNPRIYPAVKNYGQWKIRRDEISERYIEMIDSMRKGLNVKEVVRFITKSIFGGPEVVMR